MTLRKRLSELIRGLCSPRRRSGATSPGFPEMLESRELLTADLSWNRVYFANINYTSPDSDLIGAFTLVPRYANTGTTALQTDFTMRITASNDAVLGNADDHFLTDIEGGRGLAAQSIAGVGFYSFSWLGEDIDTTTTPYLFCVLIPDDPGDDSNPNNNVLQLTIPVGPRIQWNSGEELHVAVGDTIRLAPEAIYLPGSSTTTIGLSVDMGYGSNSIEDRSFVATGGGIKQKGKSLKWNNKKIGKITGGKYSLLTVDFTKNVPASVVQQVIRNFSLTILPGNPSGTESINFTAQDVDGVIGLDFQEDKTLIIES